MQPKYKRILLKLSGEALAGDQKFGLNEEVISRVVDQLVKVHDMGVEIALVIGGGNFWRGRQGTNMDRTTAIKGVFILLVFLTHAVGYIPAFPGAELLHEPYFYVQRHMGQGVVVLFLFYSGYWTLRSAPWTGIRCRKFCFPLSAGRRSATATGTFLRCFPCIC